jgi:hypothetical protein
MLRQRHAFATTPPETLPVTSIERRQVLALLGLGCVTFWSGRAEATLVRGLTLEVLAKKSDRILVGTALDSGSHWANIGGKRRIVTDTRVRVDGTISGPTGESEVLVRTHGGKVGSVGELLFGEAELVLQAPCVLFLRSAASVHHVLGMAQGHYPLHAGTRNSQYLKASPRVPEILHPDRSAVRRLTGRELGEAQALIREARGS